MVNSLALAGIPLVAANQDLLASVYFLIHGRPGLDR
jgi:hypothetical protein